MIPVTRAVAATLAYAAVMLALPPIAANLLAVVADRLRSAWASVTDAASAVVPAIIDAGSRVETVLAVFLPLTAIGFVLLFRLILWPATVDHVPNRGHRSAPAGAEVIVLDADRRPASVSRAA